MRFLRAGERLYRLHFCACPMDGWINFSDWTGVSVVFPTMVRLLLVSEECKVEIPGYGA